MTSTHWSFYSGKPGEANHMAKLTTPEVLAILKLDNAGVAHTAIAEGFGVARGTVWDVTSGRSWAHLAA